MIELFFEIHSGVPRQEPGSLDSTRKAFSLVKELPAQPRILDIGCGSGAQTIELAKLSGGKVTGMDNHEPYIEKFKAKIEEEKLSDRVDTASGDMADLPFNSEEFDLIWAEGSLYIIGMEEGLKHWSRFLKPGGYVVFSELTWLKDKQPREVKDFWLSQYPDIKTIEGNIKRIEKCGFDVLDNFVLPDKDWFDDYYTPLEERIKLYRSMYARDRESSEFIEEIYAEIPMYKKYSEYYGYVFYITKKK
jgi:ubiquinone/menaquinone biosynthesis C-methylase UbiE